MKNRAIKETPKNVSWRSAHQVLAARGAPQSVGEGTHMMAVACLS